jgi:hypothetical protein
LFLGVGGDGHDVGVVGVKGNSAGLCEAQCFLCCGVRESRVHVNGGGLLVAEDDFELLGTIAFHLNSHLSQEERDCSLMDITQCEMSVFALTLL